MAGHTFIQHVRQLQPRTALQAVWSDSFHISTQEIFPSTNACGGESHILMSLLPVVKESWNSRGTIQTSMQITLEISICIIVGPGDTGKPFKKPTPLKASEYPPACPGLARCSSSGSSSGLFCAPAQQYQVAFPYDQTRISNSCLVYRLFLSACVQQCHDPQ